MGVRIAHLRIAHQVANPEVGNPEIHHKFQVLRLLKVLKKFKEKVLKNIILEKIGW